MMIELEDEITEYGQYLELRPNRESWEKNFKDFRNFVDLQAKRGTFERYPAILVLIIKKILIVFRWYLLEVDKIRILLTLNRNFLQKKTFTRYKE